MSQETADLFTQADTLLFKQKNYKHAEKLYRQILEQDGNNIDAINSVAYCIKLEAQDNEENPKDVFNELNQLYQRALQLDPLDVEANFNVGLLHLQFTNDLPKALDAFQQCIQRDGQEEKDLFKAQFAKAYYNMGMIYDKMGQVQEASDNYLLAMKKCAENNDKHLIKTGTYKKAGTNYAVTLEKLGKRQQAVDTLAKLKGIFGNEVRVFNNLGIIQKRNGDSQGALKSYQSALQIDKKSFFPNYNMAVLLSQDKDAHDQSIVYFKKALEQAQKAQEYIYEMNVLLNMALVMESDQKYEQAIKYLKMAAQIDPENEQIAIKIQQLSMFSQQTPKMEKMTAPPKSAGNKEELSETQQSLKQRMLQEGRQSASGSRASRRKQRPLSQQSQAVSEKEIKQMEEHDLDDKLDQVKVADPTKLELPEEKVGDAEIVEKDSVSHADKLDLEEARRQTASRGSKKSKKTTEKSAFDEEESEEEEEGEEESEDVQQPVPTYGGWLKWTREQAELQSKSEDPELKKRAFYRLGLMAQQEEKSPEAVECFTKVVLIDENFCKEQVHVRLAEVYYKMGMIEDAFKSVAVIEDLIKPKDKYMVHQIRGKCHDKIKQFKKATEEYIKAIAICEDLKLDSDIIGNFEFRLGWSLVRDSQVKQGIEHLEKAIECLPDNTEVMMKLASVLLQQEGSQKSDIDQAAVLLQKTLETDTNLAEAHLLLGKVQQKQEKWSASIGNLEKAIEIQAKDATQGPPKSNSFFFLGLSLEKEKDFKRGMQNYKKCLTLDNNHFGACIHLANLLANLGEGQRAAKYFKHAIKIDGESINAHFGLGKALQQYSEDKDAPIPHFMAVLQRDPAHFKTLTQLGILYLDREEYEKSAECLKKALQANRQFPLALVSMGNLLFETGHAESAIKYHLQALKFNDKELQALIGLGNAYYDTGKPDDAVKYYKLALDIDQHLSDVHYNLGNALYLNESIDEAIKHYKSAIQLNPKKPESYYNLGNALCVKAEYVEAVQAYDTAIEIDPKNAPAFYNLGNALYMLNRYEDSVGAYVKALQINNDSPECHFNLASAYNDLQQYKKAIQHYQFAIELDESNLDAHMCLGNVYEVVKAPERAMVAYRNALKIDPESTKAQEAISKLTES